LTPPARAACLALADSGIALVSQTVLLRGVNDDVESLSSLMRAFVEMRVKPYYLHHGDLAPGTAHFRLTLTEGQDLVRQLLGRLSGLCQPVYVVDIPGGHGKAPAGPVYFFRQAHGWSVEDWRGFRHDYRDSVGPAGDEAPVPTPTGIRP
jgi:lysine 2,3-aminomutase